MTNPRLAGNRCERIKGFSCYFFAMGTAGTRAIRRIASWKLISSFKGFSRFAVVVVMGFCFFMLPQSVSASSLSLSLLVEKVNWVRPSEENYNSKKPVNAVLDKIGQRRIAHVPVNNLSKYIRDKKDYESIDRVAFHHLPHSVSAHGGREHSLGAGIVCEALVKKSKLRGINMPINVFVYQNAIDIKGHAPIPNLGINGNAGELLIERNGCFLGWNQHARWLKDKNARVLTKQASVRDGMTNAKTFGWRFAEVLNIKFQIEHKSAVVRGTIGRSQRGAFESDPGSVFNGIVLFGKVDISIGSLESTIGSFVCGLAHIIDHNDSRHSSDAGKKAYDELGNFLSRPASRHIVFLLYCLGFMYLGIACIVIAIFPLAYFRRVKAWAWWVLLLAFAGLAMFYLSHLFFNLSREELKRDLSFDKVAIHHASAANIQHQSESLGIGNMLRITSELKFVNVLV